MVDVVGDERRRGGCRNLEANKCPQLHPTSEMSTEKCRLSYVCFKVQSTKTIHCMGILIHRMTTIHMANSAAMQLILSLF